MERLLKVKKHAISYYQTVFPLLIFLNSLPLDEGNIDYVEIVQAICQKDSSTFLMEQSIQPNKDQTLNIVNLFDESIAALLDSAYKVESFLSKDEIAFLTSEEEIKHLENQLDDKSFNWRIEMESSIDNVTVVSAEEAWEQLLFPIYGISKPYFSSDKSFVFLYVSRVNGIDDGSGDIYFLKCIDSRWEVVTTFNLWIS
ncbi:MAG: hypothetical protein DCO95_08750 [Roseivirga sp. XM-24bin3]|nr:MAG: hypothetical protein DCO95_08750 [Roseivirga sp. XM-24bin3]